MLNACDALFVQVVPFDIGHCFEMVVLWQERYAEGTKQMLQNWFDGKEFPEKWYVVREGKLAEQLL